MHSDNSAVDSDEALLAAGRSGDRAAIEVLLGRYQARVFRYGMKMCGDTEDAKEVLQDTLMAAARTMSSFRGEASVPTWLFTIARRHCIKRRRHSKLISGPPESLDAHADLASSAPGPEDMAAGREVQAALAGALAGLEPDAREVLILRDMEGLTAPEVAAITGDSVDAVKSRLHRARASLRARLLPALGEIDTPSTPGCPQILSLFSRNLEGDIERQPMR